MGRRVLVTDGDTPLGFALVSSYLAGGDGVVTTISGNAGGEKLRGLSEKPFLLVEWPRFSAITARTVLVKALNRFDALDEAIVLDLPAVAADAAHELASADIESGLDRHLKGKIFMIREILSHLVARKAGVLSLASFSTRASDIPSPPLESAIREGFKGFARSVLSSYSDSALIVNAFQSFAATPEEFAQFIVRTLDEKARRISGRWFTLQPKTGLLQGFITGTLKKP